MDLLDSVLLVLIVIAGTLTVLGYLADRLSEADY
jgi:hypothetical protein